jgi:signal transduction histidine kinase
VARTADFPPSLPAATGPRLSAHALEARLALAEFLVGCEVIGELADRSLEWLRGHAGVKQALCFSVDTRTNRLTLLSSVGSNRGIPPLSLDLDDRGHPLVAVLFSRRPQVFRGNASSLPIDPVGAAILAVPLYGLRGEEDIPIGVLLQTPVTNENTRDARWLADLLGHRLVRVTRLHELTVAREQGLARVLLDAVPDPVLLTDNEGRMLLANHRAESLLATRDGESEGRRRAVALNNMFFSSALARTALEEGVTSRRELVLVDPEEGSDLLFELINATAPSREGTGIVSVLRNVSDLHRATEQIEENYRRLREAEAEVRAERDRLDLILDSVADPILVTNPSGAIVMMNAPAERLFTAPEGASAEQEMRVSANDAHFSSFVSNLFITAAEARRHGNIGLVDPESGMALPVQAVAGKVLSGHGEIVGVVTILHDRTEELEKTQLYEQLQQASAELGERVAQATADLVNQNELLNRQRLALEQASVMKSQFLANMSHEFRTPLNAIIGYTSMLLDGVLGPMEPAQHKNLARVDSNARHLLSLISDILDLSRIEAGKMPVRVTTFSLHDLVSELLSELAPIVKRSGLTVNNQVGRSAPRLRSDRAKVKQILLNLVANAVKFTPNGSVSLKAAHRSAEKLVAITVADTGIGIAEENRERVFEDFGQVDSSLAREHGGAGLGLTICRRLACVLGGEISFTSTVGQGSAFTLTLPQRLRRR